MNEVEEEEGHEVSIQEDKTAMSQEKAEEEREEEEEEGR